MTMTWIRSIDYHQSAGRLRQIYDRLKGPQGHLDNILKVHGLRPHTLEGHMALYKRVLHHAQNEVPRWFLEAIGVCVSYLNKCDYCVQHHLAGLGRLVGDPRTEQIWQEMTEGRGTGVLSEAESLALTYVARLTLDPAGVSKSDVERLSAVGWTDGQILEINQTASYFAYANRTVLGLGVTAQDEPLGLSPQAADEDDWSHS